jgi:hypothetical protein
MKACFVGKDETATIQAGDSATKGLPVGFDSFRSRKTFTRQAELCSARQTVER